MTANVPISAARAAPPLRVTQWFNTKRPLTLESLRGRVVVLHAFQMLCPSCVSHGLPQAMRIRNEFDEGEVSVIGLHTVFEHHDAMTPTALGVFLHEYRISIPIGVDEPSSNGPIPKTMAAYEMRGTPTLVLIGRDGTIKRQLFGRPSDLSVGAAIAKLVAEPKQRDLGKELGCDDQSCDVPVRVGAA